MKKFLFLSLIFGAIISTNINAQSGPSPTTNPQSGGSQSTYDPAAILQQMKKVIPHMVEKTGLTEAQANKVIEINFEIRDAARSLGDLNEAGRSKKIAELKASKEKKYSEIPLTAEQIKSVYAFYEEMGKNSSQRIRN